jgi:hypothetical protein
VDPKEFLEQFQDFLAPRLDTYEQAIYLYIVRHSRLIGLDEVTIGFKSARRRIASGTGINGHSMSENSAYVKLRSLELKGCLRIRGTERQGTRIKLLLPSEIHALLPDVTIDRHLDIEEMDFFSNLENRLSIFERDANTCFYCLRKLTKSNRLIEHVDSRPLGTSSYRNVVAACTTCNNRKGNIRAEDFIRQLYREGYLSALELEGRLSALGELRDGQLKPKLANTESERNNHA